MKTQFLSDNKTTRALPNIGTGLILYISRQPLGCDMVDPD